MSGVGTPHDKLFKALLEDPGRAATLVREYLPADIRDRLSDDPPELVDGSFIDEALAGSRSDRLFRAMLRTGQEALIYVLMEHKSSPDPRTPFQLMGYMIRIWERYGEGRRDRLKAVPPIFPLVFYHGLEDWTVPTAIADCLAADADVLAGMRDFRYMLHDLRHIPDERLSSDSASRAGLAALKYVFVADIDVETLAWIIRDLPDDGLFLHQVFEYLLLAFGARREIMHTAAARAKSSEGENLMQTVGEQLRAEGRKAGMVHLTLKALERRFGVVPPHIADHLEAMPVEELDACFDRALTAETLGEVFRAPGSH
ncbi:MAG: hypothetical protein GVY13_13285 [Alphaproteobacteria bacterium]|jgi:hypothetical protein|nr:hypothetical protein [Alphaproteobacteria bacterium]